MNTTDIETAINIGGGVIEMVTAIAKAADVPDAVKVSRQARKRAKQIARLARKLARDLNKIDGPIDTPHEYVVAARVAGWKAELAALGVDCG